MPIKTPLLLGLLVVAGCVAVVTGLMMGAVAIPLSHWGHLSATEWTILTQLRLPRVLTGFIVGGCLAAGGAMFQGILQNPLADPYILGISAGAGLGAALSIVVGLTTVSAFFLPLGAFIGALCTVTIVYSIVAWSGQFHVIHFVLAGIMVNAFFSSITLAILFFSESKMSGILFWLMGNLGTTSWSILAVLWGGGLMGIITSNWLGIRLNALTLGDDLAASMGISVKWVRTVGFFSASLLTGLAVSGGGMIGFVGLIVPHLIRLAGREDFKVMIPASFLGGGAFLVVSDTIARSILPIAELPVGIVTSCLGAPFFLWLLVRKIRLMS